MHEGWIWCGAILFASRRLSEIESHKSFKQNKINFSVRMFFFSLIGFNRLSAYINQSGDHGSVISNLASINSIAEIFACQCVRQRPSIVTNTFNWNWIAILIQILAWSIIAQELPRAPRITVTASYFQNSSSSCNPFGLMYPPNMISNAMIPSPSLAPNMIWASVAYSPLSIKALGSSVK